MKYHMEQAYRQARFSPDPSNQNGAVVVNDKGIMVSVGFNGFGVIPFTESQLNDRDWKLAHIEHAERAALFNASHHWATRGMTLVCPWACCTDCARAIGRMGVSKLVVHTPRMETTPDRWKESVAHGLEIVRLHGCEIEYYDGPLELPEGFTIKANGEDWSPNVLSSRN